MTDAEIIHAIAKDRGDGPINYLDESNPGPAHVLLKDLGKDWTIAITYGCTGFYMVSAARLNRGSIFVTNTDFCRAVCELYCRVKGIWKE